MKKIFLFSALFLSLSVISCDSDETKKDDNEVVVQPGEWVPTTIQLIKIVPLYTLDYPHTEGCAKDYLELSANNNAKFFHYEGTACEETIYENAFQRNGNNVSLNILNYQISGSITTETATNMVIESDITEYLGLIEVMFPEYEQYLSLLEGGTVKLTFNKK